LNQIFAIAIAIAIEFAIEFAIDFQPVTLFLGYKNC